MSYEDIKATLEATLRLNHPAVRNEDIIAALEETANSTDDDEDDDAAVDLRLMHLLVRVVLDHLDVHENIITLFGKGGLMSQLL
jgi:hypothetical protein